MSRRAQVRARRKTVAPKTQAQAPVNRPKGIWRAGNSAVSQVISQMQRPFGEDFSGVQVHDSPGARQVVDELGATAFTHGDHIFLGPGAPSPASAAGQRLLAHELAHVVQQRRASSVEPGEIGAPGGAFEQSADQAASNVMHGQSAPVAAGGVAPGVQRQSAGDKKVDLDKIMADIKAQINAPPLAPIPDLRREADKDRKIPPKPKDPPGPRRVLTDLFTNTKENQSKGPRKLGTERQPGQRDVGAEADKAIGTVLLPQLPLHLLFNKLTEKKPKPQTKSTVEPEQKSADPPADKDPKAQDAAAKPAAAAELQSGLDAALAAAQQKGDPAAEVHLDAKLAGQREAVLSQLESMVAAAQGKAPKVKSVKVYFGTELAKTFSLGAK